MSNYTPSTDFASKDSLLSGDPAKVVKGTEFSTEFNAIQTAVATKADANSSDAFQAGTTTLGATSVTALTDSGNLNLTGAAARITGDFSNATAANRVMFQNSVANSSTIVGVIPSGTGVNSRQQFYNSSSPGSGTNSILDIGVIGSTDARIQSTYEGSGTPLPMTFYTGGSERVRIATTGAHVGVGVSPNASWGASVKVLQIDSVTSVYQIGSNSVFGTNFYNDGTNAKYLTTAAGSAVSLAAGSVSLATYPSAAADSVVGAASAKLSINQADIVMTSANGGLGYGTGAGGTVTQATSKGTAVTLNKPTGQITMNNAALGAGAIVQFNVSNSLIAVGDLVLITFGSGTFTNFAYNVWVNIQSGGGFTVSLRNIDSVSRSEAVVLNFAIIKGATA